MTQDTIFPDDVTHDHSQSKRRILIARILLSLILALITVVVIRRGTITHPVDIMTLTITVIILILCLVTPFAGFCVATVGSIYLLSYFLYLKWTLWTYYNVFFEPMATVLFSVLMLTATISFILAALAARKMRQPLPTLPQEQLTRKIRISKRFIILAQTLVALFLVSNILITFSTGIASADKNDLPYPLLFAVVLIWSFIRPYWAFIVFLLAMIGSFIYDAADIILYEGIGNNWSLLLFGLSIMAVIIFISVKAITAARFLSKINNIKMA